MKGKTYRFDQVPSDFHEPFIISGYRSHYSSALSCLASAVQCTNETINFWTHFIPALIFAKMTWSIVNGTDQGIDYGIVQDHFTWPLIVFFLGSCCYATASAVAHMFNSMSLFSRYIFFFFDYCGISLNSLGISISFYAYTFPPELIGTPFYHAYLPVAMVTSLFSTYLACHSRFSTWSFLQNTGRLPAFAIPYIWGYIPLVYRVIYCESTGCDTEALSYYIIHLYFVFSWAFIYGTHIPEIFAPAGMFDFIGNSHHLLHIGTSVGTYYQYLAFLADLRERAEFFNEHDRPTFATTFLVFLVVLVGNIAIVCFLSRHVMSMNAANSTKQKD